MSPAKYLVLGASGFIGRHLVSRLVADGREVTVAAVRERPAAAHGPEVRTVAVDTLDADAMTALVSAARPDAAFNLAAAGVSRTAMDPVALADGNAGVLTRLLTACRGIPVVIHAGSWSEYADPAGAQPLNEDHPLAPQTAYGAAKAEASVIGARRACELGIGFVVLRLFNVYGPGEGPRRLLPWLVDRLVAGERVELTPGDQERDFVHVTDVVDALVTAAATPTITSFPAYNVCTGRATTVARFARLVAEAMGADPESLAFGALPHRPDEPRRVVGDPARLAAVADWRASIPVEAGIANTVYALKLEQRPV